MRMASRGNWPTADSADNMMRRRREHGVATSETSARVGTGEVTMLFQHLFGHDHGLAGRARLADDLLLQAGTRSTGARRPVTAPTIRPSEWAITSSRS